MFGYCKLLNVCQEDRLKENAKKDLSVRHPKICIRIVIGGLSHFGEKFAYKHKQISPFRYGSKENVHGDPKTLKE